MQEAQQSSVLRLHELMYLQLGSRLAGVLAPEVAAELRSQASASFGTLAGMLLPWAADEWAADTQPPAIRMARAFEQKFGRPGEARYEQMLTNLQAWLERPPLSEDEKELERQIRKERRRRRRADAGNK